MSQSITTTQQLVCQAKEGSAEALNELYERYATRVLAAVRARLGAKLRSKVESWDIVQEAFMASLRNLDGFQHKSDGAFLAWLAKIVENRIRDEAAFFQAKKRDMDKEGPLDQPESPEGGASGLAGRKEDQTPSKLVVLGEDLQRLEAAMDLLPVEARELVIAVKIEGLSYVEIAEQQGKSPDAVRMQANRALVALTKAFRVVSGDE